MVVIIKVVAVILAVIVLIILGMLWLLAISLHRYGQMMAIREQQRKECWKNGKK